MEGVQLVIAICDRVLVIIIVDINIQCLTCKITAEAPTKLYDRILDFLLSYNRFYAFYDK